MKKNIFLYLFIASIIWLSGIDANAQSSSNSNNYDANNYLGWNSANDLPFKIGTTPILLMNLKSGGDLELSLSSKAYMINGNKVLWHNGTTSDLFVGVGAGNATMTGHNNTLVGNNAGTAITSGTRNTLIGFEAGTAVDDLFGNTALGYQALGTQNSCPLCWDQKSSYNTAIGYQAFYSTQAYGGVAVGFRAGYSNTDGCSITAVGEQAAQANTEGDDNVAVGYNTLLNNTKMSNNIAIGSFALSTQSYNTKFNSYNIAIGREALRFNQPTSTSSGLANIALGTKALYSNITGAYNVATGQEAGYSNQYADYNVAYGYYAGHNNTVAYGTFIGHSSGSSNTTGKFNCFVGYTTGISNTTGEANTFIGLGAGLNNTTANNNSAFGLQALILTTTGGNNTAVGFKSGAKNTTGSGNTFVGYQADASENSHTNCAAYGNGAVTDASNKYVFGNAGVTVIGGQVGWSTLSDGRFKINVNENVSGLDFINKLRPVTYQLDAGAFDSFVNKNRQQSTDSTGNPIESPQEDFSVAMAIIHSGFVAQEVEELAQESGFASSIVNIPANQDGTYSLNYSELVVPLVKAVQELDAANKALKSKIDDQESLINNLINQINNPSDIKKKNEIGEVVPNRMQIDLSAPNKEVVLYQNEPNPFGNSTVIRYFIPENMLNAEIIFYNQLGQEIRKVQVNQTGHGELEVSTEKLPNAIYTYSIRVDGRVFDTKKMIKN